MLVRNVRVTIAGSALSPCRAMGVRSFLISSGRKAPRIIIKARRQKKRHDFSERVERERGGRNEKKTFRTPQNTTAEISLNARFRSPRRAHEFASGKAGSLNYDITKKECAVARRDRGRAGVSDFMG